MKKFTVILLIAVLAMTSVFAAFDAKISGSVTAKYVYDIDKKTFGYFTPNAEAFVDFEYSGASNEVAAADGYSAELKTALTFAQANNETPIAQSNSPSYKIFTNSYFSGSYFKFAISAFNIKYSDVWTLNLLKADTVGDFAKSTIDSYKVWQAYYATYDDPAVLSFAYNDSVALSSQNGVTFTWNGFKFAGVASGAFDKTTQKDFYLGVQTPEFNLGGGFTLQGAGAFNYTGSESGKVTTKDHLNEWRFYGSLKAGFASDTIKIVTATDQTLTYDIRDAKDGDDFLAKKGLKYDVDASLTAAFGPAADFAFVDVYYGKNPGYYNTETKVAGTTGIKNVLSAKVAFDFNAFGAPVTANIKGANLLNDSRVFDADAEITIAENYKIKAFGYDLLSTSEKLTADYKTDKYFVDNGNGQKLGLESSLTFGPVVVGANVYTRLAFETVGFGTSAKYTNDYFVANAGLSAEFDTNLAAKDGILKINAGLTAKDTIVKNATLSLKYASKNILKSEYAVLPFFETKDLTNKDGLGTITASVAVEF